MKAKGSTFHPGAVPAVNRSNAKSLAIHDNERELSNTPSSISQEAATADSTTTAPKQWTTKAEANRNNALKSTGPKTLRGKHYSRLNARTHGLHSKELFVSETDKQEFEEMRAGLEANLKPSTTLQQLAFDYVVVCQWRCKLALRLERQQFARQLQEEQPENEQGEAPDVNPVTERWYGSSRADILGGIRLLENAITELDRAGYFHDDTKASLGRAFGLDFVPWLEQWNTMSRESLLLAENLAAHNEIFGEPPHINDESPIPPGEMAKEWKSPIPPREMTKVVKDPMQNRHMGIKLLEQQRKFLSDVQVITGRNTLGNPNAAQSSEFNPRFLADANRELRRAMDWYLSLRNRGL